MTTLDIGAEVFAHLQSYATKGGAWGGSLILQQERTTRGEDVVVSVVATDSTADRTTALVNVNAYVPDLAPQLANTARLAELSKLLTEALKLFHGVGYRAELRAQSILKAEGRGEHVAHFRIYFESINEQEY